MNTEKTALAKSSIDGKFTSALPQEHSWRVARIANSHGVQVVFSTIGYPFGIIGLHAEFKTEKQKTDFFDEIEKEVYGLHRET